MKGKLSSMKTLCLYENKVHIVEVEVYVRRGIPGFQISGMPSRSIRESKDRIRASLEQSGYNFPLAHITINLSPTEIPKYGSHFDLSIALGILEATGQIHIGSFDRDTIILGELSLNGRINSIAHFNEFMIGSDENWENTKFLLPIGNKEEAKFFLNGEIFFVNHLSNFNKSMKSQVSENSLNSSKPLFLESKDSEEISSPDWEIYVGQELGWEALVIALSGRHHLLITGTPGTGKTMLGELAFHIQSKPNYKEWKEILSLSCSREMDIDYPTRPYRSPHHSVTATGLIGGGAQLDMGEITNSHLGILFLDEVGEISNKVLQSLREPLEKGSVSLSRNNRSTIHPARFQLIATSNLCPCGWFSSLENQCICRKEQVRNYLGKLSGPILDRIDITVELTNTEKSTSKKKKISLTETRCHIQKTIALQTERNIRLTNGKITYNSEIEEGMYEIMNWKEKEIKSWEAFNMKFNLGYRERGKIMGLGRTIADLAGEKIVSETNLLLALALRDGSRNINSMAA